MAAFFYLVRPERKQCLTIGERPYMSYGPVTGEGLKRAGYYVDRLLKGARPSELPIEQLSKLKLIVNLRTAKTLGIRMPEAVLVRADELIQ